MAEEGEYALRKLNNELHFKTRELEGLTR
jgi:hypothetical protein